MQAIVEIIAPNTSLMGVDVYTSIESPVVEVLGMYTSSLDIINPNTPMTLEMVVGSIKGDKGDQGDKGDPGNVDDYDPGDLNVIFENHLI